MSDDTTLQDDITNSANDLLHLLADLQSPTKAPNASREEREAARYLYERIINWKGYLHTRPLRGNIEYIVKRNEFPGWYYKCPAGSGNWRGPFPTHHSCKTARDTEALAKALDDKLANYITQTLNAA